MHRTLSIIGDPDKRIAVFAKTVARAWSAETTTNRWEPKNPVIDQCATTAALVASELGGDLIRLKYTDTGVEQPDSHYLNVIEDENHPGMLRAVDLTERQFTGEAQFLWPYEPKREVPPGLPSTWPQETLRELVQATKEYVAGKRDKEDKPYRAPLDYLLRDRPETGKSYEILRKRFHSMLPPLTVIMNYTSSIGSPSTGWLDHIKERSALVTESYDNPSLRGEGVHRVIVAYGQNHGKVEIGLAISGERAADAVEKLTEKYDLRSHCTKEAGMQLHWLRGDCHRLKSVLDELVDTMFIPGELRDMAQSSLPYPNGRSHMAR